MEVAYKLLSESVEGNCGKQMMQKLLNKAFSAKAKSLKTP